MLNAVNYRDIIADAVLHEQLAKLNRSCWPQLLADIRRLSPLSRYADMQLFIVKEGEKVLAQAMGIINPHFKLDGESVPVGQIGYFECRSDVESCNEVLTGVKRWLKEKACTQVIAPINGAPHYQHRLIGVAIPN
jgi:hypothetical protein